MASRVRPIVVSVVQYQDELKSGQMTVFDLLDKLEPLGADGVELRREVWANYQRELAAVRDWLTAKNLLVTYATFSTLFNNNADAHQLLLHDIDTAKALGSPLLRVFPGAAPDDTRGQGWKDARSAIDHASSLGIVIALENYGRSPGGTSDEVKLILDAIPSDALKTNIDIGNYATHGEDVIAAIGKVGSRAVYAHLKDKAGERSDATTSLGGGDMPMREIVTALNALPQEMIYCFEFVGGGEADSRIRKSIAYLRDF